MGKAAWLRIVPFAVFMGFIGLQQGLQWLVDQGMLALSEQLMLYLYPLKAILVAILLLSFIRHYDELRWGDLKNPSQTFGSVLLGIIVFLLWINMDWDFATLGESQGFNPSLIENDPIRNGLIFSRIFGAALVVPIMEELFWRSFLLRYIINQNFMAVRVGTYSLASFLIGSVLFGLEHNLVLAGVMAGVAYSLVLYWTRSISQCVLAHAVTNFILALYVLQTANWQFW
ncbi:CAAX prenyl protease-related protein [Malonomonas rubra]|uniref:CAAX prenyl protease-related protein n=1 Tax=Malonomonas rubra TaxID=57040 RepID=UPI0026EDAD54|nr:CAAX prenyl protease-related protein [Malonomonas rubra]